MHGETVKLNILHFAFKIMGVIQPILFT